MSRLLPHYPLLYKKKPLYIYPYGSHHFPVQQFPICFNIFILVLCLHSLIYGVIKVSNWHSTSTEEVEM